MNEPHRYQGNEADPAQTRDQWTETRLRLPCGCIGECDPYAHDWPADGPGKPAGPGKDDQMEMLAKRILAHQHKSFVDTIRAAVELAHLILEDE